MKNVVSKKSNRRSSLFARVVAKIYETPSSKSSGENYETLSRKFTLSWSHYVLLMRISDPVEYPRCKERRWGVRRVTIDARKQGMRRETLDASHVSRFTTCPLVSHLTSYAHPIHRKEPTP